MECKYDNVYLIESSRSLGKRVKIGRCVMLGLYNSPLSNTTLANGKSSYQALEE